MNIDNSINVASTAIAIVVCSQVAKLLDKEKRKTPRWWVRPIFIETC